MNIYIVRGWMDGWAGTWSNCVVCSVHILSMSVRWKGLVCVCHA